MDADEPRGAHDVLLLHVLESAARLQRAVPDAVLVGGSAAAWYAGHRLSFDHDHVLTDLRDRFDAVLADRLGVDQAARVLLAIDDRDDVRAACAALLDGASS